LFACSCGHPVSTLCRLRIRRDVLHYSATNKAAKGKRRTRAESNIPSETVHMAEDKIDAMP
jgi:hypothetical protein